jgi:hypothetical protein
MLPLRALRFDDDIVGAEVYVLNEVTGGYEVVDTHDARSIARAQGLHLIACWPEDSEPEFCSIGGSPTHTGRHARHTQSPSRDDAANYRGLPVSSPCRGSRRSTSVRR